jgi:hypothetical protein
MLLKMKNLLLHSSKEDPSTKRKHCLWVSGASMRSQMPEGNAGEIRKFRLYLEWHQIARERSQVEEGVEVVVANNPHHMERVYIWIRLNEFILNL